MLLTISEKLTQFADDLDLLLGGIISVEQFRQRYPSSVFAVDEDLDALMANVQHFLSDEDIRLRDDAYRRMQESEMRKLIDGIREGTPVRTLQKISFLQPSFLMKSIFMRVARLFRRYG